MNAIATLTKDEIKRRAEALGPWFHNIVLNGVPTAPDHFLGDYPAVQWTTFADAIPKDLGGKSVLDIGCNGGFYSIEMKRRGAERVLGIDFDDEYLAQARFAAGVTGSDIEVRKLSVYDVLVFQSMQRGSKEVEKVAENPHFWEVEQFDRPGYPKLHFIERRYADDPTNWWVPNRACAEAMLRSAGFEILNHPEDEVYVCRRLEAPQAAGAVYPARGSKGSKEVTE
jgi:tRNA (mo5U34)-methyltransferase